MLTDETMNLLTIGFGYGMLFGAIGGFVGYMINVSIQLMNLYK